MPLKTLGRKKLFNKRHFMKAAMIIAGVILMVIGGFFIQQTWFSDKKTTSSGINYGPPTAQEKQETEEHKKEVAQQQAAQEKNNQPPATTSAPPTNGNRRSVTPLITYAGQNGQEYQISSYINGIFEDGGVCTATLMKSNLTVTKTSTGIADASHTTCPTIIAQRSDLSEAGMWNVTISYTSNTAVGTSTVTQFTVN